MKRRKTNDFKEVEGDIIATKTGLKQLINGCWVDLKKKTTNLSQKDKTSSKGALK